jgi:hypothetical protein
MMIESIHTALASAPEIFSSTRLMEECRTFVRYGDGRAAAGSGAHDDCVMAMAIALAVRAERIAVPR